MSEKVTIEKYVDPRNPVVIVHINNVPLTITLIHLGETITIMMVITMKMLQLDGLLSTPTMLELDDRSRIKPYGVLNNVIVTLASWEYPVDFLVIQPKNNMEGHLLIRGRP